MNPPLYQRRAGRSSCFRAMILLRSNERIFIRHDMNQQSAQPQKYFLIGIIGLGVLILVGLVWAVLIGPSSENRGNVVQNASFQDANDPTLGPSNAKTVVHIYGDFQCPACKVAEEGVTEARKMYADRVKFVWKDFPLTQIHSNAMAAANAARCAEARGKFWEYHDLLYQHQLEWSNQRDPATTFRGYAKDLGLGDATFATCLERESYREKILDNMAEGTKNSVEATPTFFVNAKRIVGVLRTEDWERELKAALGLAQ